MKGTMKREVAFSCFFGRGLGRGGWGGEEALVGDLPVIYNVHDIIILLALKLRVFEKLLPNQAITFINSSPKSIQISIFRLPAVVIESVVQIAKVFGVFEIIGSPRGAITIAVEGLKFLSCCFRRLFKIIYPGKALTRY